MLKALKLDIADGRSLKLVNVQELNLMYQANGSFIICSPSRRRSMGMLTYVTKLQ
jgi:hypothetical protein